MILVEAPSTETFAGFMTLILSVETFALSYLSIAVCCIIFANYWGSFALSLDIYHSDKWFHWQKQDLLDIL